MIGVNDDNTLAGMKITDEFLRTLPDIRSAGNILPQPARTVEMVEMQGGEIAVVTKTLGFINRFGYGVLRAQSLLANNGNPAAEFEFSSVLVKVKVFKRQENWKVL